MKETIDVVKIVVENSEGLILAVRERESGKWELPGGKIDSELDEALFHAANRELKEEVNIKMNSASKLVRTEIEEFNEKPIVNCFIVHTDDFTGLPEVSADELDDLKWVEPSEYKGLDWHADSGYGIPAVENIEHYLD